MGRSRSTRPCSVRIIAPADTARIYTYALGRPPLAGVGDHFATLIMPMRMAEADPRSFLSGCCR